MSNTVVPRTAPAKGKTPRTADRDSKVSGHSSGSGGHTLGSGKGRRLATPSGNKSLKAKEEEYRRLNAELEAKTAELVKEAEHLVKGNLSLLSDLETTDLTPAATSSQQSTSQAAECFVSLPSPAPSHTHTVTLSPTQQPSPQAHPQSSQSHSKKTTAVLKQLPTVQVGVANDSINAAVDKVVLEVERTLDCVEQNQDPVGVGVGEGSGYHGNSIIPDTADDMGAEALSRFLKAKLRVMQEELDRLCQELTDKEKQLSSSEVKVKELTEHNHKLQRTHHTVQTQLEKYKGQSDSLQQKCIGLETQLSTLRKEVEDMKGRQKKASSQQTVVEVRLNRALEEVERYKTELAAVRARSEDSSRSDRGHVERLVSENKQLQKQRNELMTAFKKQMKLIDILKRQKMHMEAAKMLSFSEDEFVKALDWQAA